MSRIKKKKKNLEKWGRRSLSIDNFHYVSPCYLLSKTSFLNILKQSNLRSPLKELSVTKFQASSSLQLFNFLNLPTSILIIDFSSFFHISRGKYVVAVSLLQQFQISQWFELLENFEKKENQQIF